MRLDVEEDGDSAYLQLVPSIGAGEAVRQEVVSLPQAEAELILDFDEAGFLLGIEILGASRLLRADVPRS